jgi:hypothetical protein
LPFARLNPDLPLPFSWERSIHFHDRPAFVLPWQPLSEVDVTEVDVSDASSAGCDSLGLLLPALPGKTASAARPMVMTERLAQ